MRTTLMRRFRRHGVGRECRAERRHLCQAALAVIFVLCLPEALESREKEAVATWEQLGPLVESREIETVLTSGVYVRGRVLKVLPEALDVEVKKSSDRAAIPKGQTRIGRELLSVLTVRWKRRVARAILTPTFGAFCVLCWPALLLDEDGGSTPVGLAFVAASATVGYLLGDRIDRRRMRVILAPEAPSTGPPAEGEETGGEMVPAPAVVH